MASSDLYIRLYVVGQGLVVVVVYISYVIENLLLVKHVDSFYNFFTDDLQLQY